MYYNVVIRDERNVYYKSLNFVWKNYMNVKRQEVS